MHPCQMSYVLQGRMYIQLHDVQFSKDEDLDRSGSAALAGGMDGDSQDGEQGGARSGTIIGPAAPPTEGQHMVRSLQDLGAGGETGAHLDDALSEASMPLFSKPTSRRKTKARRPC